MDRKKKWLIMERFLTAFFILAFISTLLAPRYTAKAAGEGEDVGYSSWLRGTIYDHSNTVTAPATYSDDAESANEDNDPNPVTKMIAEWVGGIGTDIRKGFKGKNNIDASITGIIMGNIVNGKSYFVFELTDGNVWGTIGAIFYVAFRAIMLVMLFIAALWQVIVPLWKGDSRGGALVKNALITFTLGILIITIMPLIVDWLTIVRDKLSVLIYKAVEEIEGVWAPGKDLSYTNPLTGAIHTVTVDKSLGNSIETIYYERYLAQPNMANALLYLIICLLPLSYMFNYIKIALIETVLFGLFPVFAFMGTMDKGESTKSWIITFATNLMIPCIDMALIFVPSLLLSKMIDDSLDTNSLIILFILLISLFSVIPVRNKLLSLFGSKWGGIENGTTLGGVLAGAAGAVMGAALGAKHIYDDYKSKTDGSGASRGDLKEAEEKDKLESSDSASDGINKKSQENIESADSKSDGEDKADKGDITGGGAESGGGEGGSKSEEMGDGEEVREGGTPSEGDAPESEIVAGESGPGGESTPESETEQENPSDEDPGGPSEKPLDTEDIPSGDNNTPAEEANEGMFDDEKAAAAATVTATGAAAAVNTPAEEANEGMSDDEKAAAAATVAATGAAATAASMAGHGDGEGRASGLSDGEHDDKKLIDSLSVSADDFKKEAVKDGSLASQINSNSYVSKKADHRDFNANRAANLQSMDNMNNAIQKIDKANSSMNYENARLNHENREYAKDIKSAQKDLNALYDSKGISKDSEGKYNKEEIAQLKKSDTDFAEQVNALESTKKNAAENIEKNKDKIEENKDAMALNQADKQVLQSEVSRRKDVESEFAQRYGATGRTDKTFSSASELADQLKQEERARNVVNFSNYKDKKFDGVLSDSQRIQLQRQAAQREALGKLAMGAAVAGAHGAMAPVYGAMAASGDTAGARQAIGAMAKATHDIPEVAAGAGAIANNTVGKPVRKVKGKATAAMESSLSNSLTPRKEVDTARPRVPTKHTSSTPPPISTTMPVRPARQEYIPSRGSDFARTPAPTQTTPTSRPMPQTAPQRNNRPMPQPTQQSTPQGNSKPMPQPKPNDNSKPMPEPKRRKPSGEGGGRHTVTEDRHNQNPAETKRKYDDRKPTNGPSPEEKAKKFDAEAEEQKRRWQRIVNQATYSSTYAGESGELPPLEPEKGGGGLDYQMYHRPPKIGVGNTTSLDKILSSGKYSEAYFDKGRYSDSAIAADSDKVLEILRKAQNNPDMEVTVYRGSPAPELNSGDWVTLSESYAKRYSGKFSENPASKLYSYKVKASELSFDGSSLLENGYFGNNLKF